MTPPRTPSTPDEEAPRAAQAQTVLEADQPQVQSGERASFATMMRIRIQEFRVGLQEGLPFPLWCQGALEAIQVWLLGAVVVFAPGLAAWAAGAWEQMSFPAAAAQAGQWWLVMHGVPLIRPDSALGGGGLMWMLPLGLYLVPFFLAWRAGRRIARASWSDQLWQGVGGATLLYLVIGAVTGLVARTDEAAAPWWAAALIPPVTMLVGMVCGARREAGSFGRLIGFDAADWVASTSQYQRWAGSYLWAAVRAGFVGWVSAMGLAALMIFVRLATHGADVVNVALQLAPGALGGLVLALGQIAFLPNLVTWALAWLSGAGFSVGTASSFSPLQTSQGPLPTIPVSALLPGDLDGAWWFMAVPVLAGAVAGVWFLRAGENHLEEWMMLRFGPRWLALGVSTLLLGALVGLVAAAISVVASAMSSLSLGVGTFTDLGPHVWLTALLLWLEIGVGTMIGYLVAPLFMSDPVLESARR